MIINILVITDFLLIVLYTSCMTLYAYYIHKGKLKLEEVKNMCLLLLSADINSIINVICIYNRNISILSSAFYIMYIIMILLYMNFICGVIIKEKRFSRKKNNFIIFILIAYIILSIVHLLITVIR